MVDRKNDASSQIAALKLELEKERSARVAAEQELAIQRSRVGDQAKREQEAIVRIAKLSIGRGDLSLKEMLAELTETASSTLDVDRTSVWLLSSDRRTLHCLDLFVRSQNEHSEGITLAADDYPEYFRALETGRAIDAHDARNDDRTREFRDGYLVPLQITSMMDAAIRRDGVVVGVVCHEQVGDPRVWQRLEIDFAGSLADQVALVLESAERRRLEKEAEAARRELSETKKLAFVDDLTQLYNRRALEDLLAVEIERSARHHRDLSLAMLDFDSFKSINDQYGHQAGDRVLRQAARLIAGKLRAADKPTRYGGEEFCIILPDTNEADALALGERLRLAIAGHVFDLTRDNIPLELRVTASIGVSVLSKAVDDIDKLIHAADAALYQAKAGGRNRVVGPAGAAQSDSP